MPEAAEVLYVRIDVTLKRHLQELSRKSGLTLAQVTEIVLARGLDIKEDIPTARVNDLIAERFGPRAKH